MQAADVASYSMYKWICAPIAAHKREHVSDCCSTRTGIGGMLVVGLRCWAIAVTAAVYIVLLPPLLLLPLLLVGRRTGGNYSAAHRRLHPVCQRFSTQPTQRYLSVSCRSGRAGPARGRLRSKQGAIALAQHQHRQLSFAIISMPQVTNT